MESPTTLTGEPSERGFHSSVDTGTSSPAPLRGRLTSISETLRCRVESPKQGNNWRPRPDTSPLAGKHQMERHRRTPAVGEEPALRGLFASMSKSLCEGSTQHQETMSNEKTPEGACPPTNRSLGFDPIRVTIIEGAWKGEKGWITGPKNAVDANPITTDGGICLAWFDSEISKENNAKGQPTPSED